MTEMAEQLWCPGCFAVVPVRVGHPYVRCGWLPESVAWSPPPRSPNAPRTPQKGETAVHDPITDAPESPEATGDLAAPAEGRPESAPFITSDRATSNPVTASPSASPVETPEGTDEDPDRQPQRPQNAPASEGSVGLDAIGWRCRPCGWQTFDVETMRREVNRPAGGGVALVCPGCDAVGSFIDAYPDAVIAVVEWCRVGAREHPARAHGEDTIRRAAHVAKAHGLLAQDPLWRATPEGEQALRDRGLLHDASTEAAA